MKISNTISKNWFGRLLPALLGLLSISAAHAQIFVVNNGNGTIGEYNLDGSTVNASLITGLNGPNGPNGIVVSGSNLFVENGGSIGEYTTSGATVNASLITGLNRPFGFAVSGSDLFVATYSPNTIGEYTTSGATVNASLLPGLYTTGIVVSGSDLFELNAYTIGEYTTSGATVNASLTSGEIELPLGFALSGSNLFVLNNSEDQISEFTTSGATVNVNFLTTRLKNNSYAIAVSGSNLFVTDWFTGTIEEYTTSGVLENASLISGLDSPFGIAVEDIPEPSTWALLLGGLGLLAFWCLRTRRALV